MALAERWPETCLFTRFWGVFVAMEVGSGGTPSRIKRRIRVAGHLVYNKIKRHGPVAYVGKNLSHGQVTHPSQKLTLWPHFLDSDQLPRVAFVLRRYDVLKLFIKKFDRIDFQGLVWAQNKAFRFCFSCIATIKASASYGQKKKSISTSLCEEKTSPS